jgi:molybdenum cofactor guanylyltransferase
MIAAMAENIHTHHTPLDICYLILAGGRGQRMAGADKGLMLWQGKPMIEHIMQQLGAQSDNTIISANRNQQQYAEYATQVISDSQGSATGDEHFQGPLAGLLSALEACSSQYLLCVPCDSPAPPKNLRSQLQQCMQKQNRQAAACHDGERLQPLFLLLSTQYRQALSDYLQQGHRKVQDFITLIEPAICDFSAQREAFRNFNSTQDMQA